MSTSKSAAKAPDMTRKPGLVGRYVHKWEETGGITWQGEVVSQLTPTAWLIEWFSWMDGSALPQTICTIEELSTKFPDGSSVFRFYSTGEEMRDYWDTKGKYLGKFGESLKQNEILYAAARAEGKAMREGHVA